MIDVDSSDAPLVAVRVAGHTSDDEVRGAIARLEELLRREGDPYALLLDVRDAELPTTEQLELVAASFRANDEAVRAKLVGLAFVTANPATVAAVRALVDMAAVPVPFTIEARLSRARAWTRARLSEIQV